MQRLKVFGRGAAPRPNSSGLWRTLSGRWDLATREGTLLALMVPVLALRSFSGNAGPSVRPSVRPRLPPISGRAHGPFAD